MLLSLLELKSRDQGGLAGCAEHRSGVDESEAGRGLAASRGLRRQGISRSGIIWFGPIENVGELGPDSKGGAFFDAELAAHTDVLYGAALVPVVAIVKGGSAKLAWRRIGPSPRIENKSRVRVEAVTIEVVRE
jgi:hypothetical protein